MRCVVVGAGVVGLAIARELHGRGLDVVVLERTGIGAGASGVQPGGVRQQWGTRVACRLAAESVAFWREAAERLESRVPLVLRRGGYLFVAHSARTVEQLAANVRLQNEEGIPSRIVSPDEAATLVPDLRGEAIAGGAWCGEDGYFDRPQAVVEAFAAGLDVRRDEVASLSMLDADAIVVAAGAETRALVAPLGVDLPVVPEERHLFYSGPIHERLLEPLVVAPELAFAAKQLADGRVLAADLRGDSRATIRDGVGRLLPRLAYVSLALRVTGAYDVTPDHQPVLGEVADGVFVACGFSGHGFMIAPAVARITADAVLGRRDEILDVLGVERFARGRLVPESQLV
ncbi:MAG TPA: FAD-dependent oxidoreductase [Gaiellaceae bacterium]